MEITAKKTNKVFSLDKIDFEKQPRAQRVSDRTEQTNVELDEVTSETSRTLLRPCWKIHKARVQIDPGPHGEGSILSLQQRGRPDHS